MLLENSTSCIPHSASSLKVQQSTERERRKVLTVHTTHPKNPVFAPFLFFHYLPLPVLSKSGLGQDRISVAVSALCVAPGHSPFLCAPNCCSFLGPLEPAQPSMTDGRRQINIPAPSHLTGDFSKKWSTFHPMLLQNRSWLQGPIWPANCYCK